jgi:hypothetical protein
MLPFGSEAYHCWAEPFKAIIIALDIATSFPHPKILPHCISGGTTLGSDSPSHSGKDAGNLNFGGHSACSSSNEEEKRVSPCLRMILCISCVVYVPQTHLRLSHNTRNLRHPHLHFHKFLHLWLWVFTFYFALASCEVAGSVFVAEENSVGPAESAICS